MHSTEYDTIARNNVELKIIMLCGNKQKMTSMNVNFKIYTCKMKLHVSKGTFNLKNAHQAETGLAQ